MYRIRVTQKVYIKFSMQFELKSTVSFLCSQITALDMWFATAGTQQCFCFQN